MRRAGVAPGAGGRRSPSTLNASMSRILVADDETSVRDAVGYALSQEGFDVVLAEDGNDADRKLGDGDPGFDLLILDIMMPGRSGLDICRDVRARSAVPIIVLTAKDAEVDKVVGLEVGADDYVTKPFSPRELLARVRAVLRRSEEAPRAPAVIEVGAWVIDGGRREVTTPEGKGVRPTAREFDLLWFLAENRGLVLSRAQILEAVWGYDYFGETRTVDVHVRQLRKKMDGIPIETAWGVGYRMGN